MTVIGITGQTGAGKSTVCRILEKKGFYHIDADEVAHGVVESDRAVLKKLAECFGDSIIKKDGTLSRPLLAKRAFKNKETAHKLDSICYPAVISKIEEIIAEKSREEYIGIMLDAIGLFESGADRLCDFTVCVTAPREIRLQRIIGRDKITEEAALRRIDAQKDEGFFVGQADFVIINDGKASLEKAIGEILKNEQATKKEKHKK